MALVELAKKQNTIVNLGTGQGKTLIALLLIKHYAKSYQEGKQTLFLVWIFKDTLSKSVSLVLWNILFQEV